MNIIVVFSLVGAVAFPVREGRQYQKHGAQISLDDKLIDSSVKEVLQDDTIRLLSCQWLLEEAEAALPSSTIGLPVLQRRQEMPDAAFLAGPVSADIFASGTRRVPHSFMP